MIVLQQDNLQLQPWIINWNQWLFLAHSWAVEPTNVNYTARIGGLYGTLMRAEVLLPAKIHYPVFIRKFSKALFL